MKAITRTTTRAACAPPASPLSALECRQVEQALVRRSSRAGAVIVTAMREQVELGPWAEAIDRRGVGERQVAMVSCPTRAAHERWALVETEWFGFGDADAAMPTEVDVAILRWVGTRDEAEIALTGRVFELHALLAPAPVRPPTLLEQARDIAERLAAHALEARTADEPDMDGYVAEATAEIVALLAAVSA